MTGREHLAMYSRLRGVPEKNIPYLVEFLAKSLSVDQHIDKVTKAYRSVNVLCTKVITFIFYVKCFSLLISINSTSRVLKFLIFLVAVTSGNCAQLLP